MVLMKFTKPDASLPEMLSAITHVSVRVTSVSLSALLHNRVSYFDTRSRPKYSTGMVGLGELKYLSQGSIKYGLLWFYTVVYPLVL
jgi:hypothetical protein